MRAQASLVSIVAAGAGIALLLAGDYGGRAAPTLGPGATGFADRRPSAIPVDTELVIGVDVSNSMDPEEQALQREGYILGITSPEFLTALRGSIHGKVAVTYFEWAGLYDQKIVVPWRVIDGPATAAAFAKEIGDAAYRRAPRTSIFGALQFAKPLFDASGYNGVRRVIDISGDGNNNMGPPVTIMRDQVLAEGITINGLPIMLKRPYSYEDPGPRHLLRGLRHRRPGLVRHPDSRARSVQGSDPHQASPGDRRPYAAAARLAGAGAATARLLFVARGDRHARTDDLAQQPTAWRDDATARLADSAAADRAHPDHRHGVVFGCDDRAADMGVGRADFGRARAPLPAVAMGRPHPLDRDRCPDADRRAAALAQRHVPGEDDHHGGGGRGDGRVRGRRCDGTRSRGTACRGRALRAGVYVASTLVLWMAVTIAGRGRWIANFLPI